MSAKLGWGLPLEVSAIHCLGVTDIGLRELVDRGLIFGARQGTDSICAVKPSRSRELASRRDYENSCRISSPTEEGEPGPLWG